MRLPTLIVASAAGLGAGILVPPSTLAGEPARQVATFLGLVAASILPTITLLVNTMDPKGRSILRIKQLRDQIEAAMHELFVLFGLIVLCLFLLIAVTWVPAVMEAWSLAHMDAAAHAILGLLAYAMVVMSSSAVRVPKLLLACLDRRTESAEQEGVRQVGSAAQTSESFFDTPDGFGERVDRSNLVRSSEREAPPPPIGPPPS